jgi:putative PIN family toxin of toxin-antitoxin system
MILAVFDCNVVMAAIGWRSEAFHCLVNVARREVQPFVTTPIIEEYRRTALNMEREMIFPRSPWPALEWFISACSEVEPAPLGKQRSRDKTDDQYIAGALAAKAGYIVSRDPDLLALQKPFGISIVTPRQLLSHLAELQ